MITWFNSMHFTQCQLIYCWFIEILCFNKHLFTLNFEKYFNQKLCTINNCFGSFKGFLCCINLTNTTTENSIYCFPNNLFISTNFCLNSSIFCIKSLFANESGKRILQNKNIFKWFSWKIKWFFWSDTLIRKVLFILLIPNWKSTLFAFVIKTQLSIVFFQIFSFNLLL
jgi:hypothetical protein